MGTTGCREGKGMRITWWRHDRRPAGGQRLLALGALGSLPSRRTKVPTTGKRHTVPLHLSHLSYCYAVPLCHCTCHTFHTVPLHLSHRTLLTRSNLPLSAECTIVKADPSIMEESALKPRFLSKFLVGQYDGSVC